jgi:hypothetical protein
MNRVKRFDPPVISCWICFSFERESNIDIVPVLPVESEETIRG